MKTLLCFGDSNTYGLNPKDKSRFDYNTRWTGILEQKLSAYDFRVVEEGLCGRTTMFPDKFRSNRCGIDILPVLLESHSPIDYITIMLGTNDCKVCFNSSAYTIALGVKRLINQVHNSGNAKILLISPIHLAHGVGEPAFDPEFNENSVKISKELKKAYSELAKNEHCLFLAASDYVQPSEYDREHIDETGHKILADAIFKVIYNDIQA